VFLACDGDKTHERGTNMNENQVQDDNDTNDQDQEYERKPAFQVNRFKKSIHSIWNEEFGELLLEILNDYDELPTALYAFRQKLDMKLHDGFVPQRNAA